MVLLVMIGVVSCDKEEVFHLSSLNCTINGKPFKYEVSDLNIMLPWNIRPVAKYYEYGDSTVVQFFLSCYPKVKPPYYCNIDVQIAEQGTLRTKTKYPIASTRDVEAEMQQLGYLRDYRESFCVIAYCYQSDTIPTGETVGMTAEIKNKYYGGLTEGYIEFTTIDREHAWVKGNIYVTLRPDDAEELVLKGDFRLYTEFLEEDPFRRYPEEDPFIDQNN